MLHTKELRQRSLVLCLALIFPTLGLAAKKSPKPAKTPAAPPALAGSAQLPNKLQATGRDGEIVSVYSYPSGTACDKDVGDHGGKLISIVQNGKAKGSFALGKGTTQVTLSANVNDGDKLCLTGKAATAASGDAPTEFAEAAVAGPTDEDTGEPPFARTFYTAGAVASNQLSTANSTSAAQYIDFGFTFNELSEAVPKHPLGINTSFAGRFSTVPVSAGVKSGVSSTNNTANTLNILSSQESARILATISFPFLIQPRIDDGDALFMAFIGKGSFNTLLNPSTTLTAPSGGTATVQFSPTYNDWSIGGRLGYRNYKSSTSGLRTVVAVEPRWQIDFTMGKFSNLQDIQCGQLAPPAVGTAPANTSCYLTIPASSTTKVMYEPYALNRVSVPRLELDGFARITTPFVIGIDANLSQYSLLTPKHLDTLNRSGSDVRIYFGVTGSMSDLFKKLGIGNSSNNGSTGQ